MPLRGEKRGTRIQPVSMTTRMPSMVREDSAMEVASTTLRRPGAAGSTAASCSPRGSAP